MVNASKIRCVVVVATPEVIGMNERTPNSNDDVQRSTFRMGTSYQSKPRFRPSDLLPWADPHIRSLVEQLQAEVREETASKRTSKKISNKLTNRLENIYPPAAESIVGEELFGEDFFNDDWFDA